MTEAPDLLAAVAARYGATVAPDARVQRVAPGVSAQPLPQWDGKQLIYPDWKARLQAASASQARSARMGRARLSGELGDRLRAMHAEGARVPAMAEALGLSRDRIYGLLAKLGLRMERDPAQYEGSVARMVAARTAQLQAMGDQRLAQVRRLIASGLGQDAIARELGLRDMKHVRSLMRKAVPDHVFPVLPRGPKPKPRLETVRGQQRAETAAKRQVHQARNAAILAQHRAFATVEAICLALGLRRAVVARVLRDAGEVPFYDAQRDYSARIAALPGLIAEGMGADALAARWGVSVQAVHTLASRAGVSLNAVRPKVHNKGKISPRVASRRQWIAAMVRRGATDAEMLRTLDIHPSTLSADIAALGLSCTRKRGGDRRALGQAGQDVSGEGVAA